MRETVKRYSLVNTHTYRKKYTIISPVTDMVMYGRGNIYSSAGDKYSKLSQSELQLLLINSRGNYCYFLVNYIYMPQLQVELLRNKSR